MKENNSINLYSVTLRDKRNGNVFSMTCTYFDLVKYAERGYYELKSFHKIGSMKI